MTLMSAAMSADIGCIGIIAKLVRSSAKPDYIPVLVRSIHFGDGRADFFGWDYSLAFQNGVETVRV
jgi:hypothetical protein